MATAEIPRTFLLEVVTPHRLVVSEERELSDDTLIERIAGGDADLAAKLRCKLGSDGFNDDIPF